MAENWKPEDRARRLARYATVEFKEAFEAALAAAREEGFVEGVSAGGKQGHAEERDRIVAWLRGIGDRRCYALDLASDAEAGEHWKTPPGKEPF